MRGRVLFAGLAAALAGAVAGVLPAFAEGDFSAGSRAKEWGLFGEEKARFSGRVVDVPCALTGDCPADCGAGTRQMAILRAADGALVLAVKNGQPAFSGATWDLAPFCGREVEVDGLLIGDPEMTPKLGAKLLQVQWIRPLDGAEAVRGEAVKANRFTREWARRHPEAKGKGPWFRRDPGIRAEIEKHGYLGLGAEADAAFAEENF